MKIEWNTHSDFLFDLIAHVADMTLPELRERNPRVRSASVLDELHGTLTAKRSIEWSRAQNYSTADLFT